MAQSGANTVEDYIAELPEDRRATISTVRDVILQNLPEGYAETVQNGMIGYVIPLASYPVTYNKQPLLYAALAAQKNYTSLYLMGIYGDAEAERWFVEEYRATGKKLDMGKSCVRFKTLADLPLGLVGQAIASTSVAEFIERYEASRRGR
jgi:uncharacterized protein YdhG (YjbR/CyaY superfamily)